MSPKTIEKVQETKTEKPAKKKETTAEFISSMAAVLVTGLFIITFCMQAFEIPSGSMENTLLIGDHLFVDRGLLAPKTKWMPLIPYQQVHRRDIIVFVSPAQPGLYLVKRVIGVPGDHIHLKDDVVYINGQAQEEKYKYLDPHPRGGYVPYATNFPSISPEESSVPLNPEWQLMLSSHLENGDLIVPPDSYFAMGDNRENSWDGRFWGFVPKENLIGRPMFIYWSFITPEDQYTKQGMGDRLGFIVHIVIHFFDETRWSRMFRLVH
ncbi:signal peptidase I [Candidatus Koribacter versatilis Ellin345]|uniref:Signal peptidase I n=1 Tax=Koribacter versatilis (strain Ellin345) TaxID=204669 RepID=Q1IJU4_KORVE|nr:signal peptidase I [Candidatus Koribacter versatilis]ABF42856.1 signal peptidase I [Candidatus Koribacter versatilis Ellin345]